MLAAAQNAVSNDGQSQLRWEATNQLPIRYCLSKLGIKAKTHTNLVNSKSDLSRLGL